jgi:N-acetylmuramoyl-L-alanine amidase
MPRAVFLPDSCIVADAVPSPNHGERAGGRQPDMILLHYTGMLDANDALERLSSAGSDVSAHYFIFEDGRIVQLVHEDRRAWHAGASSWAGETDINSCSIGIEIANPGHEFGYPDFPGRQIAAVTALCRSIFTRHAIPAKRVLAHSDVAPARKQDPGEKFPWRTLHDSGIGHWVKPTPLTVEGSVFALGDQAHEISSMQQSLAEFGYGVGVTGLYDTLTHDVVMAFQRHFRPQRVDGISDPSTRATLHDLVTSQVRPRNMAARARAFERLAAS